MARSLLTATGDTHRNGPANFHRVVGDARGPGGVRGAGVPRGPAPVCELPQPPARPLDSGRLSRPRRRLRAAGARPRGQGRSRAGTSLTRGPASRPGRGSPASASSTATEDGRAALAEWLTGRATRTSPGRREPPLESPDGPRPGRARRRPPGHQSRRRTRNCSTPWRPTSSPTASTSGTPSG